VFSNTLDIRIKVQFLTLNRTVSLSSQNIKQHSQFAKVAVSMSKFLVNCSIFPNFPQNAGLFMDNVGQIGRSLMDNWGGGGVLGSSLIFYFVASIFDPRSTIQEKCEPKPILIRGTVPQRVIMINKF
jgi:hypothetical protein